MQKAYVALEAKYTKKYQQLIRKLRTRGFSDINLSENSLAHLYLFMSLISRSHTTDRELRQCLHERNKWLFYLLIRYQIETLAVVYCITKKKVVTKDIFLLLGWMS